MNEKNANTGIKIAKVDVYQSYLTMKINRLEVHKLSPNESRHHKRMANFMLEAYKDALAKYREVKRHEQCVQQN